MFRSLALKLIASAMIVAIAAPAAPAWAQQPSTGKPQAKPQAKPAPKPADGKQTKKRPEPMTPGEPMTPSQIGIDTLARYAYLLDAATGAVLLSKAADEKMLPSSMAKMMTIYLLWEEMKAGRVTPDTQFRVSERAWRMQGSKMFLDINSTVAVKDLIPGIIVHSGNDASVAVAEGLAASEEAFAERMNKKAREIGMTKTNFMDASGWPIDGQHTSAHDLAVLAERTIRDFPDYYKRWYAEQEFRYQNFDPQANRNPLLRKVQGADGLKTGHTDEAGYGLTASAIRGNRRLVLVVNGLASTRSRAQESERLLEWAFREFDNYAPYRAGEQVVEADVWLGVRSKVPLALERDVVMTLPRNATQNVKITAVYDGPVAAPIAKGQKIGRLVVTGPNMKPIEAPLVAMVPVEQLGTAARLMAAFRYYILGSKPQS